jgi:arginase
MTASPEGWDVIVSPWHLDEHLPEFPAPAGMAEAVAPPLTAGTRAGRMRQIYTALAGPVARAGRPLLLSGDCAAALGAVAGLQRRAGDLAVIWLDAHGDFNTPQTTTTGYLGGMPLAMLTGRAPELFCDPLGLRPLSEDATVLVDARDLDPAEREALAASRVRQVPAEPGAIEAAVRGLAGQPVYLHLDLDVVDGAELPGLRYPVTPGPGLGLVEECLTAIMATADVAGACVACTWRPEHLNQRPVITRLARTLGARLTW